MIPAIDDSDCGEGKARVRCQGIAVLSIVLILLGSAVRVRDRISLALLGVSSNIPVVCACGLQSDSGCPVVHVLPSEPKRLLAAFAEVLGNREASRAVAA